MNSDDSDNEQDQNDLEVSATNHKVDVKQVKVLSEKSLSCTSFGAPIFLVKHNFLIGLSKIAKNGQNLSWQFLANF